jgi:2'-5' RNA ligase
MVRCFIGFLLPENVKKHVIEMQKEVARWPLVCKFVEEENLHVCLSFIGEVDEHEVDKMAESLDEICKKYSKFEIVINKIRAIPNESYIRVLALDVSEKTGSIEKISKEIVQKIGGDSKPPHLTLCRVKNVSDKKNVAQKIRETKDMGESFFVEAVQLIKSELRKPGPVYSVIHESKLRD